MTWGEFKQMVDEQVNDDDVQVLMMDFYEPNKNTITVELTEDSELKVYE